MSQCAGKARFLTEAAARARLAEIAANPDRTGAYPRGCYQCPLCQRWHLTKRTGAQAKHRGGWRAKRDEAMTGKRWWP